MIKNRQKSCDVVPLANLTTQYPIIQNLAQWRSTVDLYHLVLTSRELHGHILASPSTFEVLKRNCLCDGRGLIARQEFNSVHGLQRYFYKWGEERHIWQDEPIEVRLYKLKCASNHTLPCRKCIVNVCEQCRYYPRGQDIPCDGHT